MKRGNKTFCNCCGKEFSMQGDMFLEEFLHIEREWGYFSNQDGYNLSADVCEKCLMDWMQGFRYQPEKEERVEL